MLVIAPSAIHLGIVFGEVDPPLVTGDVPGTTKRSGTRELPRVFPNRLLRLCNCSNLTKRSHQGGVGRG